MLPQSYFPPIFPDNIAYPPLLREVPDAPKMLFTKGQALSPSDRLFAIVGTRHPSLYGKQMARHFSEGIAKAGFTIVSGLAYGIDAIAHRTALDAGAKTIAVLGSGLDEIAPTCNIPLAQAIEKNGTLLSEYPPGTTARKSNFPQRNRIIAGMSQATLVIEAPEKSGALITARLALDYNRYVFAIPGNITQETSKGTNMFLRDGRAYVATNVEYILETLGFANHSESQKSRQQSLLASLSGEEKLVYLLLQKNALEMDELMAQSKFGASQINVILFRLELKGLITLSGSYAFVTR